MNHIITNTLTDETQFEIVHPTLAKLTYPDFDDIDITIKSFGEIISKTESFDVQWKLYNIDVNVSIFDIDRQDWFHIKEHLTSNDLLDWEYDMPTIESNENSITEIKIDFINKQIFF